LNSPPGWRQNFIRNGGDIPDRWQWEAFPAGQKAVMLNSDVALVKQLDDTNKDFRSGQVPCVFTDRDGTGTGCPPARGSIFEPMLRYARDNRLFLRDFHRVMVKMANVGYSVDGDTCDLNGVCQLRPR